MFAIIVQLLSLVALTVLSVLLNRPKKQPAAPISLPQTSPGEPVPVAFGTVKLAGRTVWLGRKSRAQKVTESAGGILGALGATVQIGYEYLVDMAVVLCHGPIDALVDIIADNGRRVGQYGNTTTYTFDGASLIPTVTNTGSIQVPGGGGLPLARVTVEVEFGGVADLVVNAPNLYGGKHRGGGVVGTIDLFFGVEEQPPSNFYATFLDPLVTPVPSWPGICYAVFGHTNLGQSNTLPPLYFEVQRWPQMPGSAFFTIGSDANPIHIIYECLTNTRWGLGTSPALIDQSSSGPWILAANAMAPFVDGGENFGLSGVIDTVGNAQDVIDEILRTIDAVLFVDPTTGLLTIKLIRADYVASSLGVIDPSSGLECEFQQTGWRETFNEVNLTYTDRTRNYQQNSIRAQNLASIQQIGYAPHNVQYSWVCDEVTALRLAERDVRAGSLPLAKCTLRGSRVLFPYRPGDVFKLTWPQYGISNLIMRVGSITRGALDDGTITVECVQDVFSLAAAPVFGQANNPWTDPSVQHPFDEPVVVPQATQTTTLGTLGLQIYDPDSQVVLVQMATGAGTTVVGNYVTVTGPPYQQTVALFPQRASVIAWIVTWVDSSGNYDTISGAWTFEPKVVLAPPQLSLAVDSAGNVTVTATVGEELANSPAGSGVRFASSTSAYPSDLTTDGAPVVTGPPYTYTATLTSGQTLYVSACAWDTTQNSVVAHGTIKYTPGFGTGFSGWLVNGDVGLVGFISDGSGQPIGVPL